MLGVRGPFGTAWPLDAARGARRRGRRRRRSGSRRCAPRSAAASAPRRLRPVSRALRRPHARRPALRARARAAGARREDARRSTSPSTAAPHGWRGQRRRRHEARRDARASTRRAPSRCVCGPEVMMRFTAAALLERGVAAGARSTSRWSATCSARVGHCGHCQLGPMLVCRDGPVYRYDAARRRCSRCASCERRRPRKPKLAVWKFASCDGCQLSLLDCEDELLALAGEVEIAYFLEATQRDSDAGPYDLSLVEGSITTARRRRADPRGPRSSRAGSSRSAPARPRAESRRCATSPTSTDFIAAGLRAAGVHRDARHLDADLGARRRSTSSCAAVRSTSASCSR